ncbi:MBL fold metallo-hydrolase [Halegenticoccus tardaugens]|uniref:MBL fold metallo-hydrolase n=1 Tax=Halegenticoccus tardaugens TaxID=2071624 RepID=UPI00100B47B5|nr:MBL fold metallo-hydrolase [Halegenticoccus tardaugens]
MRLTESLALVGSGEARLTDRYDCNVYAIEAPDGAVLVDMGGGRAARRLLENARGTIGDPVGALLTHAHADHSQGGPALQRAGVPVIASNASADLLRTGTEAELGIVAAKRDGVYPPDYEFANYEPDRAVAPGTTITVGGRAFDVVSLRGHASDHVCYVTETDEGRVCFVGDAVYPDGSISLLNVSGSSLAAYRSDIGNLCGRDIDALLPGHGLPRLEDGQESVDQAAEALDGMYVPPSKT